MTLTEAQIARFSSKFLPEPNSGCWLWDGAISYGYGLFSLGGKLFLAHRVSYEHFKAPIPEGLQLDHLCRVRCCVNPEHMELVTSRENTIRGLAGEHNKRKTHCPQGHPYDEENTLWCNGGKHKRCKICVKSYSKPRLVHASAVGEADLPKESPHD